MPQTIEGIYHSGPIALLPPQKLQTHWRNLPWEAQKHLLRSAFLYFRLQLLIQPIDLQ